MVTGRVLKLTGVTLDAPNAPKLKRIDPIEAAGSIYLFDWTHPGAPGVVGVPETGAVAPNVLGDRGAALIGEPAIATFASGAGWNSTKGLLERSGKGGLHGVVSPTLADGSLLFHVSGETAIKEYIQSHPDHLFYHSVWSYVTKGAGDMSGSVRGAKGFISRNTSPTGMILTVVSSSAFGIGGVRRTGVAVGATGPELINHADDAWYPSGPPASASAMYARLLSVPPTPELNYTDTMRRLQGGAILYRCYLEDLTVSGRTYAEVDAIDYALYTKEVLTEGGRYYGDTYTDPATIP